MALVAAFSSTQKAQSFISHPSFLVRPQSHSSETNHLILVAYEVHSRQQHHHLKLGLYVYSVGEYYRLACCYGCCCSLLSWPFFCVWADSRALAAGLDRDVD
jgi:hypothetical protein